MKKIPESKWTNRSPAKPFAVVGEAAPAEEACGVKGPLRRAHEKCVPVDGLLAGVGRNRINPGAARRVAIGRAFDEEHVAERARCVDFARLLVDDRADALAADLHNAISLLHRIDHGEAIFHGVRHRLFAVDVFAGGAGIHHDAAMLMVHHGYDHRVYIFAVEDFLIVASGRDLLLHGLLRGLMAAVVEIADRDTFDAWDCERRR